MPVVIDYAKWDKMIFSGDEEENVGGNKPFHLYRSRSGALLTSGPGAGVREAAAVGNGESRTPSGPSAGARRVVPTEGLTEGAIDVSDDVSDALTPQSSPSAPASLA